MISHRKKKFEHFKIRTSRTCCWSPRMPNDRMTNHSLRARNRLLNGICQCCKNRSSELGSLLACSTWVKVKAKLHARYTHVEIEGGCWSGQHEYQPKGGDALRLGSKGRYGLCVGGIKTMSSHCYTRAISERFRDKGLIIKCYINSAVHF